MDDSFTWESDPIKSRSRLAALASSDLMDTPPEEVFTRLIRLATQFLGTPVGLFSLVDTERQYFKAHQGLSESLARQSGTPLSHSFCQHVIRQDAPLVVRDARSHPDLSDNPAINEHGVVAYLGVPVHAPDGEVLGSFCAIQSTPREWTDAEIAVMQDIVASVENEIKLRSVMRAQAKAHRDVAMIRDRLNLALKSGGLGTYDLDLVTGEAQWDPVLHEIWGLPEGTKDTFNAAIAKIHPDDIARHDAAYTACMNPSGSGQYSAELRILKNGPTDIRWLSLTGLVQFEDDAAVRMVGTVKDIDDAKRMEEHTRLLTQELNHRVKNLFAMTTGLVSITARESKTPAEMEQALRSRIVSLSAAHDLVRPAITREHQENRTTEMKVLCGTILAPHVRRKDQIIIEGPSLGLTPKASSSLALLFHELATNAVKYGALTRERGRVDLTWAIQDDILTIDWIETGGPEVDVSDAQDGFGSTLIDLTVRRQLFGSYDMTFAPEGLHCRITIPWARHATT